MKQTR